MSFRIKCILMGLILSANFAGAGFCEEAPSFDKVFYAAGELYAKGNYEGAAAEYEKILASGYASGNVYYNLGNAYFKAGNLGKAILNYERARRRMPRDPDVNTNYKFVSSRVNQPAAEATGIWEWAPLKQYSESFSLYGLIRTSSVLYVLIVILIAFGVHKREMFSRFAAVAAVLFVFLIFNVAVMMHITSTRGTEAVIMAKSTDAHYGPSDSTTVFFKLYEGTKVNILKDKDDWLRVKRFDGRDGWIHKDALEII